MRIAGSISLSMAVVLSAACGSGTTSNDQPVTDDGGAEATTSGQDASNQPAEAGPDAPADDGPYPAAHYPMPLMKHLGGAVLTSPKIVTVTFVGDANRDAKRTFDDSIVQGAWWTTVTDGWSIGKGTGGVYAELPDTVSGKTLDDQNDLQPMIAKWVSSGALPAPDANTVYAIYFPSATTISLQGSASCSAFGGYHNSTAIGVGDAGASLDAGAVDAAYAVLPDCGGGLDTVTTSHEFIEAATDPHPMDAPAWYGYQDAWWGAGGGEVGDACQSRGSVTVGSDQVTKSWVNSASKASHDPCQPEDPGEIFFAAAVPTEVVTNIKDPTGGPNYDSDGYMLVKPGDTKTVDVVLFSEAKLPGALQVVAGSRIRGSTSASQVGPIATGVTVSLSPTTGHNGTHVTLTLAVATTTAAGDYPFVVRAFLTETNYHSWPVVLRVQ